MPSLVRSSQALLVRLWRNDAPLTATALLMLALLAACAVGLVVDPRLVTGAPVWLKPAKFAASISVYCLTLAWLFGYLEPFVRTRRFVGRGTAVVMPIEMGIISLQAARGTTSHFNVSTPLNAALFTIMGAAIVLQTLSTLAVVVALFRQRFDDRALGWAARLGLTITVAGALLGGVMTRPTEAQLADIRAGQREVVGAHTVSAPDGSAGVPITRWSREHGDLRAAHFVGLHALQALPLLALGLRRTRASSAQRVRLVVTSAGSYAALVGVVLAQALRGRSVLAADPSSVAALVAWFSLSAGALAGSLASRASPKGAAAAAPRVNPA